MISILMVVVALAVAYLASAVTMPWLVRVANTRELFDFPDLDRRGHEQPVPRLGGVAVFVGLVAALALAKVVDLFLNQRAPELTSLTFALGAGSAILFILGLYDDVKGVPPIAKLAAQLVAALLVVQAGFRIDVINVPPDFQFSLGVLSVPVTLLWLVGLSNALNLVDGMDGLAGGVSIVALLITTGAAVVLGNFNVTWQTFALIGALLGFLRFNVPPAKVFLGDSGSLVVGFLLAVVSVKGATRQDGALYALAPIFALSYPLLDTGIAILRRFLRSEPFSRADGRHIHHQLRAIGFSPWRSVVVVLAESTIVGLLGLCVTFAPPALTVLVALVAMVILVVVFVYGMRWLQYHEFHEAGLSVGSAFRNVRGVLRDKIVARDVALLFDTTMDLEGLSTILHKSAEGFGFISVQVEFGKAAPATADHGGEGWRLEYPIGIVPDSFEQHAGARAALVIICPVNRDERISGPERVAKILAPAIARWLDSVSDNERVLPISRGPLLPRSRRVSGEYFRGRTTRP